MNDFDAKQCHEAMLKYLRRQGDEKEKGIIRASEEEFKQQKQEFIEEEQRRITQEYKNKLATDIYFTFIFEVDFEIFQSVATDEIKLKIQRSSEENVARIQKMKTVNTLIEKLYKEATEKMIAQQKSDPQRYKEFLRSLIVQGLIKLMEPEVHIRVRKSDLSIVNEVHDSAADEYKSLMKKEVKLFKDRDVPLKLVIEQTKFLPEYDSTEGADSCMGGVMLHARKGRIVCSNTIDERLQLVYQEAIPEIRSTLFPSFNRKKVEEVSTEGGDPNVRPAKHH